ncbi:hypothetical protein ABT158_48535 [Nonomuraea sp. NPDC001636]|uniref:response regulator transcription factor n=1 Tax=Nonomuraea sp. NPDC001636 TaxID=3154391 RepID=UPI003328CBC8
MSGFELVASLVGSLAWPVAVVVAVWALRRPLAAAIGRVKHLEAAGVAVELAEAELAEVEQAREGVEAELAEPPDKVEVDELVKRAAELGWSLGRIAPDAKPDVVVDRSGEKPVVRSPLEDLLRGSLSEDSSLSTLERQVLHSLGLFGTDEAAAEALGISVRTYRGAVANVMQRLGARTRFQAALLARERGLL